MSFVLQNGRNAVYESSIMRFEEREFFQSLARLEIKTSHYLLNKRLWWLDHIESEDICRDLQSFKLRL